MTGGALRKTGCALDRTETDIDRTGGARGLQVGSRRLGSTHVLPLDLAATHAAGPLLIQLEGQP